MKRYLIIIPALLFIVLNACGNSSGVSPAMHTAVVQTMTATFWTPTFTPIPMYVTEKSMLTMDLYNGIETTEVLNLSDQLDYAVGGDHQIRDVKFLPESNIATSLEVDVNCVCAVDRYCCTPQRTFVIVMMAMSQNRSDVLYAVPTTVTSMKIMSFNPNGSRYGGISVQWVDVMNFLNNPNNANQFKYKVTTEP